MCRFFSLLVLFLLVCLSAPAQHRWYTSEDLHDKHSVPAITHDRDGNVWCIAVYIWPNNDYHTVQRLDSTGWTIVSTLDNGFTLDRRLEMYDIACDSSGRIIVGMNNVVSVWSPGSSSWTFHHYTDPDTSDYPREREYNHIVIDQQGGAWMTATGREVVNRDTVQGTVISSVYRFNEVYLLRGDSLRQCYRQGASSPEYSWGYMTQPQLAADGGVNVSFQRKSTAGPALLHVLPDSAVTLPLPADCPVGVLSLMSSFCRLSDGRFAVASEYNSSLDPTTPAYLTLISSDLSSWTRQDIGMYVAPRDLLDVDSRILIAGRGLLVLPDSVQIDYPALAGVPPSTTYIDQPLDLMRIGNQLWIATNVGIVVIDSLLEQIRSVSDVRRITPLIRSIHAFPNPAPESTPITIELPLEEWESIESMALYDLRGRMVPCNPKVQGRSVTIESRGLVSGSYQLVIPLNTGRTLTARFSITR